MLICVYGAASKLVDNKYLDIAYSLGKTLAEKGNDLIFGAGGVGVMGAVAKGFFEGGGKVHGVIPKFFEENGFKDIFANAEKITRVDTMSERKDLMETADAFIIAPGGIGTLDEFFEIYTLKQLGRTNKPIVLLNCYNFYDTLLKVLEEFVQKKIMTKQSLELFETVQSVEEAVKYLEEYDYSLERWNRIK